MRFWDGGGVAATVSEAPTFFVRRPTALAHFICRPGTLGLGRAYVDGSLAVDDLDGAFVVVDEWEPPALSASDRVRLGLALVAAARARRAAAASRPRADPARASCHSVERDAAAVRYHYDVGNEFFALFLDESMTYSCAIFSRGAQTLEQAQRTKLELVASKLGLRAGHAACWTSAAAGAASRSTRRASTARRSSASRCPSPRPSWRASGWRRRASTGQVEIRVARLPPAAALARSTRSPSIGMSEHVGESQIDVYARHAVRRCCARAGCC